MEKETTELAIWLKTFLLFVSALISAVFFFVYLNRYIIFNHASGANGSLTFASEKINASPSGLFATQIVLNSDNAMVRGTDVKIAFDQSKLELIRVMPWAKQTTSLKTFTPLNNNSFDYAEVVSEANKTGIIQFNAITADMEKQTVTTPFKGITVLAELTFRSIQPGETTLSFLHTHPTQDSTIIENIDPPQNILTRTNKLTVISEIAVPSTAAIIK
ncbi:MAG: hypothetical protein WC489_04550 [Patescibacteria group bacterium]